MTIPRSGYPALFNTTRASQAVKDLHRSRAFYAHCFDFAVDDEDHNALYLRGMEEARHRSIEAVPATTSPGTQNPRLRSCWSMIHKNWQAFGRDRAPNLH